MRLEQCRLLILLDEVGGWTSIAELDEDPYLYPHDDLFVPSLVAQGWVDHDVASAAIRINEAGRAAFAQRG
ncbi:hypothetical protein [Methylobacterium isbiliense]|jgi:hypothetical protein|uniref:Uncharacterized protein n=1 Tax=Methylobacterium isbiliense TaxID=315478 RepID=A0ABQ4SAW5_9HYPH|nr:hypothetical protein [Methylobacterium isbiliense]MDN3621867.1 hypothetical protein [Methylobacterium isbiliense]GJD99619.1 hypothetical protein GMJLKIPL_1537 [Methylobacterium isbiliense]